MAQQTFIAEDVMTPAKKNLIAAKNLITARVADKNSKTMFKDIPEGQTNYDPIIETAERIVIDYANLSGRDITHRAEFRERVEKHLRKLIECLSLLTKEK